MVHARITTSGFVHRRHLEHKAEMDAVVEVAEPKTTRRLRHQHCGTHAVVYKAAERAKYKMIGNFCGYRTCPRCWNRYKLETSTRLAHWIGHVKKNQWRFVTLTIRSMQMPLTDQLTFLQECFRRLRQTEIWKQSQQYGKGIIEVTYNQNTRMWHPHLHIVCKGTWIDQEALKKVWMKCTGGSHGCHVTVIKNAKHLPAELTKYLGKLPKLGDCEGRRSLQEEYYTAIRNRKMVISFGRGAPKMKTYQECIEAEETEWIPIGTLQEILERAALGNKEAIGILKAMETGDVQTESSLPPPGSQ